MNTETLERAMSQARRFLIAAELARQRRRKDWQVNSKRLGLLKEDTYTNISKENAACKRASLDLTRVLAELRR